jgi:tetratricopeptide (TPR) repeat protein
MKFQELEQYVLDAEKAFEQGHYLEGKAFLESALAEEPTYGKAHNHLGWLYLARLDDFEKAERHLRLALKYSQKYSAPYIHLISLLFELKRMEEHERMIAEAMKVPGMSMSFLYSEKGKAFEVKGKYTEAIKWYRKAIRWSMEESEINAIRNYMKRAKSKRWLFLSF